MKYTKQLEEDYQLHRKRMILYNRVSLIGVLIILSSFLFPSEQTILTNGICVAGVVFHILCSFISARSQHRCQHILDNVHK